jgi:DNA-binding CsgD family transcriptional regulator
VGATVSTRRMSTPMGIADVGGRRGPGASVPEPGAPGHSVPAGTGHDLTARERDVLRLVAQGRSDREIAAALRISLHTAKTHVRQLRAKLGAPTRAAAAHRAARDGLV